MTVKVMGLDRETFQPFIVFIYEDCGAKIYDRGIRLRRSCI